MNGEPKKNDTKHAIENVRATTQSIKNSGVGKHQGDHNIPGNIDTPSSRRNDDRFLPWCSFANKLAEKCKKKQGQCRVHNRNHEAFPGAREAVSLFGSFDSERRTNVRFGYQVTDAKISEKAGTQPLQEAV